MSERQHVHRTRDAAQCARYDSEGMASKILIQGRPGVGKTTLVRQVAANVTLAGGFVTEEVRKGGLRVGFQVEDVVTGATGDLARSGASGGPRVGKYTVDVASFERVGVAALHRALEQRGCVVIDEIGKMELHSQAFSEAVEASFDADKPVLATIPAHRLSFVERLRTRSGVEVVQITRANRDELAAQLAQRLDGQPGSDVP
ncbi:MAG: NTPase [bacterium]